MTTHVLHDYVTQRGGAERVALLLADRFGGGELTTSVYKPGSSHAGFDDITVHELLPHVPEWVKGSRAALAPLSARAFSQHNTEADVVLCSSSGWAHWTATESPTVVYCYTPPRWFWAANDYFLDLGAVPRRAAVTAMAAMRPVDRRKALSRTRYIAISSCVRERIEDAYGVEADVVFPPAMLDPEGEQEPVEGLEPGFVLTIARDRRYKNIQWAQEPFHSGGLGQLVVVGSQRPGVQDDSSVLDVGRVSEAQLRWLYANCRAVLALSREDFGLTPVEGHLFGKPTIAWRAGGYLDTCLEGENAVFTESLGKAEVRRAVLELDARPLDSATIRRTAERFSVEAFCTRMGEVLSETAGVSQ